MAVVCMRVTQSTQQEKLEKVLLSSSKQSMLIQATLTNSLYCTVHYKLTRVGGRDVRRLCCMASYLALPGLELSTGCKPGF